jgi:hypothetical protein
MIAIGSQCHMITVFFTNHAGRVVKFHDNSYEVNSKTEFFKIRYDIYLLLVQKYNLIIYNSFMMLLVNFDDN